MRQNYQKLSFEIKMKSQDKDILSQHDIFTNMDYTERNSILRYTTPMTTITNDHHQRF